MIYEGSRYENVDQYMRDGIKILERNKPYDFTGIPMKKHLFMQSDTLFNLANTFYEDSTKWWVIMEANPKYATPSDVKVGDILNIPVLEGSDVDVD